MQQNTIIAMIALLGFIFQGLRPAPLQGETVLLWKNREAGVYGSLPDSWQPMTEEELQTFSKVGREILRGSTGDFVAGFQMKKGKETISQPYILVFANREERISREQMQKTYAWFERNSALVSGVLPSQVKGIHIENIEYLQDRFTIIFQIRIALDENPLTGISGTVFLQNGYLNIIGLSKDTEFQQYKDDFYSFISTLSVPSPLRYDFADSGQAEVRNFGTLFFSWVVENWKPIVGMALLLGVYVAVFRREGGKLGEKLD